MSCHICFNRTPGKIIPIKVKRTLFTRRIKAILCDVCGEKLLCYSHDKFLPSVDPSKYNLLIG